MSSRNGFAMLHQYLAINDIDIEANTNLELLEGVIAQLNDQTLTPDTTLLEILEIIESSEN